MQHNFYTAWSCTITFCQSSNTTPQPENYPLDCSGRENSTRSFESCGSSVNQAILSTTTSSVIDWFLDFIHDKGSNESTTERYENSLLNTEEPDEVIKTGKAIYHDTIAPVEISGRQDNISLPESSPQDEILNDTFKFEILVNDTNRNSKFITTDATFAAYENLIDEFPTSDVRDVFENDIANDSMGFFFSHLTVSASPPVDITTGLNDFSDSVSTIYSSDVSNIEPEVHDIIQPTIRSNPKSEKLSLASESFTVVHKCCPLDHVFSHHVLECVPSTNWKFMVPLRRLNSSGQFVDTILSHDQVHF